MTPTETCYRHPAEPSRARCVDCGRGMCAACFDTAAWPWKVCADCQPKREAANAAAADAASAAPTVPTPEVTAKPSGTILSASAAPRVEQDDDEELPQLRRGSFARVLVFLAAVTIIPLLLWLVAAGIQGAYEGGIRPAGLGGMGGVGRITAAECRGSGSGAIGCLGYNLAGFVMASTPIAVAAGPVLVFAIAVASWLAGRSRLLLLLLFVPGAYLTLITLTLLVALQGAQLLATLFAISSVTGGMMPFLVIALGLVSVFGVFGLLHATVTSIKPAVGGAYGVAVTPEQAGDALNASPTEPAIVLIDEPEKIEEELSATAPEHLAY